MILARRTPIFVARAVPAHFKPILARGAKFQWIFLFRKQDPSPRWPLPPIFRVIRDVGGAKDVGGFFEEAPVMVL